MVFAKTAAGRWLFGRPRLQFCAADELLDMVRQKARRRSNADFPPGGGAATKLNNEKKTKGTKKQKKYGKKKSSNRHAE